MVDIMQKSKLGILIYENVQPMDFIGPWEVLSFWRDVLKAPIDMYLISEHGGEVKCDDHITIKDTCAFDQTPPLDYFIVAGGRGRRKEVHNEKLIAFIQKQARNSKYILSVCTGMFLLHKAGLLEGKSVTTYWRAIPEMETFKDVKVVGDRVVKNGNLWLAGGISSGIDLAFELIAAVNGKEAAGKVQLLFEYFPRDTVFCTPDMIQSLPCYDDKIENASTLPDYILDYIAAANRRKN